LIISCSLPGEHPWTRFLNLEKIKPSHNLQGKDLLSKYLKKTLKKASDDETIQELMKTTSEVLSVKDFIEIYSGIARIRIKEEIKEYKNLETSLSTLCKLVNKNLNIIPALNILSPTDVKEYLHSTYRPILKNIYEAIDIKDFTTFSNAYTQICTTRDNLSSILLRHPMKISFSQSELLEFLAIDFAELYEGKICEQLTEMLKNEINVFLNMALAYLKSFTFPNPQPVLNKYDELLYSIKNDNKEYRNSSTMSKALTQASTYTEAKKGVRESYLKVYPAITPDKKSTQDSAGRTKVSFKTMKVDEDFRYPLFLVRSTAIRFENPHKISYFTYKVLGLFDNLFKSMLSDSFPLPKITSTFFEVLFWYIRELHKNIISTINELQGIISYVKLLKFTSDVLMLRARVTQYVDHLKFKRTLTQENSEVTFLFQECQLSCHNMQAELQNLINRLIIIDIRQTVIANIEEQKWKYHKEYLTSLSWQIAKSSTVQNIIKNEMFLKLEEEKIRNGAVRSRITNQDLILMTPTNGILSLHNYLLEVSDKFFVIGHICDSIRSLSILANIIRNCGEEVFATYYSLTPSRTRNKQYAFDLYIFSLHLKAYMNHLFLIYLNSLLSKEKMNIPNGLDYEFINEIISISKIYQFSRFISIFLSVDQLGFLNILRDLQGLKKKVSPGSAIFIKKYDKEEVKDIGNSMVYSQKEDLNKKQPPILILNELYEYLVAYIRSKEWKAPTDIIKHVIKTWRNIPINKKGLVKSKLKYEDIVRLKLNIKNIIKKEKKYFFSKPALQIHYAVPVMAGSLQVSYLWPKIKSEKIIEKAKNINPLQLKEILLKRHEVCEDESLKLNPEDELVKKKIMELASSLD